MAIAVRVTLSRRSIKCTVSLDDNACWNDTEKEEYLV